MKTEMRKRNLWERIKLAFRLLFSNDALLPVYQEGFEDGKSTVYDDYRVVKEELAPFIKQMTDTRWHGDRGIVVPGIVTTRTVSSLSRDGYGCLRRLHTGS